MWPQDGVACVLLRMVHASQEVVTLAINDIIVRKRESTIILKINWSWQILRKNVGSCEVTPLVVMVVGGKAWCCQYNQVDHNKWKQIGIIGLVWLLFLKTVLENSFWEKFLRTVFCVFRRKKNCVWELNYGKQFLFWKTVFILKNMFYWVNKKVF